MKEKLKNKNLIIIGIFIISIIILILGGALIYNQFFYSKTYSEVETIMVDAAKEYFTKNKDKLPKEINASITVTDKILVKSKTMDTITSYTKDKSVTCSGKVVVTHINKDKYRYNAMLDCQDAYKTQTLTDYINENVQITTSGDGLYNLNNELVYRGEYVNNYLMLNNKTYRIVKITNGHPVIILTDESNSVQWDNHYNSTINSNNNTGINDYENSRMRTYLNKLYDQKGENALLKESNKLLIASYDLPIGRRSNKDTDKTGSLEKAVVLTNQYIGLLPVSDYLNASTDKECTETTSLACQNYNYLTKYKNTWWTITANSTNTYKVYVVNNTAYTSYTNSSAYVRPVMYLVKDTVYVSGDGSSKNPYKIK